MEMTSRNRKGARRGMLELLERRLNRQCQEKFTIDCIGCCPWRALSLVEASSCRAMELAETSLLLAVMGERETR